MKRIWQFFASTWLTIVLAAMVCVVAAWGSILVMRNPGFYSAIDQRVLFPWLMTEGTASLGLTLWIFILIVLISLFTVNTVVCTTDKVYAVFTQNRPWQALFPHIVHVGFLVALLGHFSGSVWGFRSYGNVLFQGETTPVKEAPGLSVRLDNFKVTPGPDGGIEDLKTTVTLFEDSKEVKTGDIQINGPLIYKGVDFYHMSQGRTPRGLVLDAGGEKIKTGFEGSFTLSDGERFAIGRFLPDFAVDRYGRAYSRSGETRNPYIEIISQNGERGYLSLTRQGSAVRFNDTVIRLDDLEISPYVVLTINKDPGIWLIIVGSIILVAGMVLLLFFRGERSELVRKAPSGLTPGD